MDWEYLDEEDRVVMSGELIIIEFDRMIVPTVMSAKAKFKRAFMSGPMRVLMLPNGVINFEKAKKDYGDDTEKRVLRSIFPGPLLPVSPIDAVRNGVVQ